MDTRVDPCEDFYQFTCGNWAATRLVAEDSPSSWFSERTKHLQQWIVDILQMNSSSTDPKPVKQARTFYRSCTDTDTLDELGLEPMFEVLDKVGLPRSLPNATTASSLALGHTLAAIQRILNSDVLVQLSTHLDPTTNRTILLVSPSFSYSSLPEVVTSEEPHSRLTGNQLFKLRLAYISEVLREISPVSNNTGLVTIALRLLFTDAHFKTDIRRSETEDPPLVTTYRGLQDTMDNARNSTSSSLRLDWAEYLSTLMKGINVSLNIDSPVAVQSPAYMEALARRLSNSKPQTIQRFVWWKVVESMAPHTTTTMRRIRDTFIEALFGVSTRITRSKRCGKITKSFFNYAISYVLATQNNLEETTKKVQGMLMDITSAFSGLVHSLDWMDPDTKAATLGKAAAIRRYIGYPEWLFKPDELDKLYSNVTVAKDKYLWNMLGIKGKEVTEVLSQLGNSPPNQTDFRWDSDPLEVNAYYSRTINAISIPAGILQMPFYFLGLEALNYGAIGSILGHELTHGFDIEGKDYDKTGERISWWNSKITNIYNRKAECFVDQYSRFSFGNTDELRVNGTLTLAENIADNGGIREAIHGYRLYTSRHGPEPYLPGLQHYSHEQLLFLAFAHVWCEATTPQHEVLSLSDSHSPNKFRVLGSLSNSPEFASIWNCRPGSRMNPTDKCILW
ncbi:endothelin-converting enzyme homolog [Homalodisca vitripennis]|uniref:endothelin-converting enzyme homolog n=1 Tax=Homalodisca vitripennis TaxID=197043 RepID=UPI001EEA7CE4|nr:endothelin-converting enzyme homolog [Homalodisca vitripennis]